MDGPRKVIIIQNVAPNHHHVVYIDGVAREFDRSRFDPVVILQHGPDISAHYPPINYRLSLLPGKTYSPVGQLRFMTSSLQAMRREGHIAAIHCINPFSSLIPAIAFKKLSRPSPAVIYDLRGLWVEFGIHAGHFSPRLATWIDKLDRSLMQQCDRVIAISPKLKEVLIDKGVPSARIEVVPGGVDLEQFQTAPAFDYKSSLGWEGKVLGYIASISLTRNSQDIIEAFDIARRRATQPLFLAMIGPIYEPEYFKSLVKSLGLQDCVKLFGQVPHKQVPGLMKGLDVAISYFPGEDFIFDQVRVPYKVLEYFAAGVPMVLTDQECHRTLVHDRQDAYLVKPTVDSLADGLLALCQNEAHRKSLGQNARQAAEQFSFPVLARKLEAIYEAALHDIVRPNAV